VGDLNLFTSHLLESPTDVQVKVRYATPPMHAVLSPLSSSRIHVQFRDPQRALSPGQSAVFYEGDHVLGGGIIQPF
jgi:tRNA-specific 2-thiouridylase